MLKSPSTVLIVGDLMIDVVVDMPGELVRGSDMPSEITTTYGGTAANVATWLAKVHGKPRVLGAVGDDMWGREVLQHLGQFDIDSRVFITDRSPTGIVIALCHPDGERSFFPDARANSHLSAADVEWSKWPDVSILYMSGYTLFNLGTREWAYSLMVAAKAHGVRVVLDPASSGPLSEIEPAVVQQWLAVTDVLIPNQQEFDMLCTVVPTVRELVAHIAIKRGAAGVIALESGAEIQIPAVDATIVDTVGAGDAFAAGLLHRLAAGESFTDSARFAVKVAAQAVSIRGAQPSPSSTLDIV